MHFVEHYSYLLRSLHKTLFIFFSDYEFVFMYLILNKED